MNQSEQDEILRAVSQIVNVLQSQIDQLNIRVANLERKK